MSNALSPCVWEPCDYGQARLSLAVWLCVAMLYECICVAPGQCSNMACLAFMSCHVASSLGIAGNWRQLYQAGQESLKQKAAKLGKRLRAMTQAEVQSRQTKHVEVSVFCRLLRHAL